MKLDPYFIPHTKINSKWIKDVSVRAKGINLLEENTEVNLHDLVLGNGFLDMTSEAQMTKEKQLNWSRSELKTFVLQWTPSREYNS